MLSPASGAVGNFNFKKFKYFRKILALKYNLKYFIKYVEIF